MAKNGEKENPKEFDEQTKTVLRVRELFHGRFTFEEIEKLLHLHSYEQGPTVFYILSSDPQEICKVLDANTSVVDRLNDVRINDPLVEDAKRNLIGFTVRQFTCHPCNRMWWWKTPKRKPISRCKTCQTKYEPVPEEVEFGRAEFLCKNCGNIFKGHGQKTTTRSECYQCHSLCYPIKIEPPVQITKKRNSKSHHSCDAPDCYNQIHDGNKDKNVRGPSGLLKKCVHPHSKRGDNSSYYPCDIHKSTGSTVDTFLSQDFVSFSNFCEFSQSLDAIHEDFDSNKIEKNSEKQKKKEEEEEEKRKKISFKSGKFSSKEEMKAVDGAPSNPL